MDNFTKKFLLALMLALPAYAWADPATIIILVGQVMAVKGTTMLIVAAGYALVAAGVIYGSVSKRRAAKKAATEAKNAYNSQLENRGATILSGVPPWRIVYGRATLGGSIHAMFTADKIKTVNGQQVTRKDALHYIVYVFAAHEVGALHNVFIDNTPAGPFDANGWSMNSEFRLSESLEAWGHEYLTAGASVTVDKPFLWYYVFDAIHNGETYTQLDNSGITITNGGKTATNNFSGPVYFNYTNNSNAESSLRFIWHSGHPNQAVDPTLNSLFPDKWTTAHRIRGRSYAVIMVDLEDSRFQGGPPNITVDVTGKLVYDPRNATTTASSNAALCIRDFLLAKYGANADPTEVNDTYAAAAANACDTWISVDIPGYLNTLTYTFSAGGSVEGWVGYHAALLQVSGAPTYMRVTTTERDCVVTRDGLSFAGSTNRYVRFNLRRGASSTGEGWSGKLYYKTAGHDYTEDYRKDIATGFPPGGAFREIVFDMHSLTLGQGDWKNSTITGLRFRFGIEPGDVFEIDWISVSEYAPDTELQPKYTINGAFTTDDSRESVLENMAVAMCGFVTNGGQWLVVAGSWTAPIRDFTDDDLDGQIAIVQTDTGLDELANSSKGTYYPVGVSSPVEFTPYKNATLVTNDGEELWEDISLPYTNAETRARNIARIRVERTRSGQILTVPLKLHAWPVQVGDRIRITSTEYGLTLKTYRVTDWGFGVTGAVVLTVQEDAEEIYDEVDTTLSDPTPNTDLPNPNIVQLVENLAAASGTVHLTVASDGTIITRVQVSWDPARDAYLVAGSAFVEIIWRRTVLDPVDQWNVFRVPATSVSAYVTGASEHEDVTIGARYVNSIGREGAWSYIHHVVIGKSEPPSNVTGLAYANVVGGMRVTWDTNTEADYLETEIKRGVDWATGVRIWVGRANEMLWVPPSNAVYTLWAIHRDTTGNESAPVSLEATYTGVEVGGSQYSSYIFTRSGTQPATPTGDDPTSDDPQIWWDFPPAANGYPLWVSIGTKTAAGVLMGTWSVPVQIEGSGVMVQYSADGISGWDSTFDVGDSWARYSTDNGVTWTPAIKIVGEDGGYAEYLFRRAATQPTAPTSDDPTEDVPQLWFDAPPAADGNPLWTTYTFKNADGTLELPWSTPVQLEASELMVEYSTNGSPPWDDTFDVGDMYARYSTDGGNTWTGAIKIVGEDGGYSSYIFKRSATQPGTPVGDNPALWYDAPPAPDGNPLWTSFAFKNPNGTLDGLWSTPVQLEGAGVMIQYSVNGTTGWDDTFDAGDLYARYSTDNGATWTGAIKIVGEDGENGTDGGYSSYVFKRSATLPTTPTGDTPAGWFDAPPAADGNPLWASVGSKTAAGVLIGVWTTPVQIEASEVQVQYSTNGSPPWDDTFDVGDMYARYSTDGGATWTGAIKIVGEDGEYSSYVFKRSATLPTTPTGNTPAGWFDAPPVADGNPLWVSIGTKNSAGVLQGTWSVPVQIEGAEVQVQYSANGSTGWDSTYDAGVDFYARYSTDGGGSWTGAIKIVGEDGADGGYSSYIFKRSASQPATPTGNTPAGWFDAPPAADGNPLWASIGTKTSAGVLVGLWSTPVQIEGAEVQVQYSVNGSTGWDSTFDAGDLYARYSTDGGGTWTAAIKIVGEDGDNGLNAQTLTLSATGLAFIFADKNATVATEPANIVFTAALQNVSGTVVFSGTAYNASDAVVGSVGGVTFTGVTATSATLTKANFNAAGATVQYVKITATLGSLSDTTTVYRGDHGSSVVQIVMFNEAHTLPAANDGTVSSYVGSGTSIGIFEGTTQLDYDGIGTAVGKWTASRSVTTGTMTTPGALSESGALAIMANHAGMTSDLVQVTVTATGKTLTGASFSISKVQSLAKSKQGVVGEPGLTAQTLTLSGTGFAFVGADAAATTVSGPTLTFTANLQNITGTATFDARAYNAAGTELGTITLGGSGNSRTLTAAQFTNSGAWATWRVVVTATLSGLSDIMTVYRGNDGSDAVQAVLSNEAHTLPTTAANVITFTGSGTTIRVFEGTSELDYDGSGLLAGKWTATRAVTSGSLSGLGAISESGLTAVMADHSGTMSDAAQVTVTITGKTATGASFPTITKIQSLAKSLQGAGGPSGADSVQVTLTNPSPLVPADATGQLATYSGTGTLIYAHEGDTELTYDGVGTSNGTWKVVAGNGITWGGVTDPGAHALVANASAMTADTASITYRITGKRASGAAIDTAVVQTFSKKKGGGTTSYWIDSTAPVIVKTAPDAATSGVHANISVTAKRDANNVITTSGYLTVTGDGDVEAGTATLSSITSAIPNAAGKAGFTVRMYDTAAKTTLLDVREIPVVFTGGTAITAVLTNDYHSVPTDASGGSGFYGSSGTQIHLYEAGTALTHDTVGTSNSTWKVVPSAGITLGGIVDSGSFATVANHSSMFGNSTTIVYTVTGKRADGTAFSTTAVQNLSKVLGGADGTPGTTAQTLVLNTTGMAFIFQDKNAAVATEPASITFTAVLQNISGAVVFSGTAYNAAGTMVGSAGGVTLTGSGVTRALSKENFNAAGVTVQYVTVTATLGGLSDSTTIYRGDHGSSVVQAVLSNEAHTLPTNTAGTVTYTGSGSTIRVFEGTTELDYDGSGLLAGKWTATRSVTSGSLSVPGAISESGLTGVMADHSGTMSDAAQVTVSITGKTATGASFSISKVQSLAKSWQGATGTGTTGSTGTSTHRVYRTVTIGAAKLTPANTTNGAVPTSPATWYATPQTVSTGQEQYQSDGTTLSGQTTTTWTVEYPSYLKVGNLSAISADMGTLTAGSISTTGYVKVEGLTTVTVGHLGSKGVAVAGNTSYSADVGVFGGANGTNDVGVYGYSAASGSGSGVYGYGYIGVSGAATQVNGSGIIGYSAGAALSTAIKAEVVNSVSGSVGLAAAANNAGQIAVKATSAGGTALDVNGRSNFTGQITSTFAGAPFVVGNTTVVTNLNADLHDGYHAGNGNGNIPINNGTLNTNLNAQLHGGLPLSSDGAWWGSAGAVATLTNAGVLEGVRYLDFRNSNTQANGTVDYAARLSATAGGTTTGTALMQVQHGDGVTRTVLAGSTVTAGTDGITVTNVPAGRGTILKWLQVPVQTSLDASGFIYIPYV